MNLIEHYAIEQILLRSPDAKRKGFGKTLRDAIELTTYEVIDKDEYEAALKPTFIPDLYMLDATMLSITLWEIEDTSTISEAKLRNIIRWWFTMDSVFDDWDITLIATDRYGYNWREIDLALAYTVMVKHDAP